MKFGYQVELLHTELITLLPIDQLQFFVSLSEMKHCSL